MSFRIGLVLRLAAVLAIVGLILFGSAGRTDLPFFWAYLATLGSFAVIAMLTLPRDLLEERFRPGGRGQDNLAALRAVAALTMLTQWILAGLDVGRFHWSDTVPAAVRVTALAAFAACLVVWYWAMRANRYFSAAVRIQRDRGHTVVSSGPYRFLRHPGYAGIVWLFWGGPIALGSWWAAVPHLALVVLLVRRAALEDRMLRSGLDGYEAYAASVRYRLFPGVW